MHVHFYDIESFENVFSLADYHEEENHLDIYLLVDNPEDLISSNFKQKLFERIYEKNQNFNGSITIYDLVQEETNRKLASTFGVSDAYRVNDPDSSSTFPKEFRITCDTDPEYDENKDCFMTGYNSSNYDTTMLAMYFTETWMLNKDRTRYFMKTSASYMRQYSNDLFTDTFIDHMPQRLAATFDNRTRTWSYDYKSVAWRVRKNMLMTGRHIDTAALNEKMKKVGLKRVLGMLGYQILESERLNQNQSVIENEEQLIDMLAYNTSDVVNLPYVFYHKNYSGPFSLKRGLLKTYPELIYEQKEDAYAPEISPKTVRRDRLTPDSSSQKFAANSLCPYGRLPDIEFISYMYPSERKSKELGIPRVNVLEESKKFFYNLFPQPELRAKFDNIYNYYKALEGTNINRSDAYQEMYGHEYQSPKEIPTPESCIPYFDKDGNPTSCFVNFSIGGIHGAEYNKTLYDADIKAYEKQKALFDEIQTLFSAPEDLKKAKKVILSDGLEHQAKEFLKSNSTMKKAYYKEPEKPELFKMNTKKTGYELNRKYGFTSASLTNHEDFTSYYPNLLRMLSAFYNPGLGYDRYAEIFDNKQKYGKLMKDKSLSKEEREWYSTLREGTKLILNTASGAGDANFDSPILMNNTVTSMRIIGQLFTWRIGQAQTYSGAKVPSTNTDGLYTIMEAELNNQILEKEAKDINVEIEPELIYLISKDTNNRLEMDEVSGETKSANGGTLACYNGPNPTKSLAHPAIIDYALSEYLIVTSLGYNKYGKVSLSSPFNEDLGRSILTKAASQFEPNEYLRMYQNILASSPGSVSYVFGHKPEDTEMKNPIIMQHYNRIFLMKDDDPDSICLATAISKKITPITKAKRERNNERSQQHNPVAAFVLKEHGVDVDNLPKTEETAIKKIPNIETDWKCCIINRSLKLMTEQECQELIERIDQEKYLKLLKQTYEDNWMNKLPETEEEKPNTDNIPVEQPVIPNTTTIIPENPYPDYSYTNPPACVNLQDFQKKAETLMKFNQVKPAMTISVSDQGDAMREGCSYETCDPDTIQNILDKLKE